MTHALQERPTTGDERTRARGRYIVESMKETVERMTGRSPGPAQFRCTLSNEQFDSIRFIPRGIASVIQTESDGVGIRHGVVAFEGDRLVLILGGGPEREGLRLAEIPTAQFECWMKDTSQTIYSRLYAAEHELATADVVAG